MRNKINLHSFLSAVILAWTAFGSQRSYAQGTAFSYQGQLMNNGQPAGGKYDLTFTLFSYDEYGFPVGPVLTNLYTPVNGGLFYATLDFGTVFNGSNYWLEIAVRTNGNGNFTVLEPRQFITPVPYAVFSANASNAAFVSAGGIIGTIPMSNLGSNVAILTANGTLPASDLPTTPGSTGGIVWQTPSNTTVQAQSNTGYVLTNSQQVLITLPATPNIGDIIEITGASLGGWVLAQNAGQTIGASFLPVNLPGDAGGTWYSIVSSSDGTKLAVVDGGGGGIWTSINSGTNWAQTSAPNGYWQSIASSSDGTKLAAAAYGIISNDTQIQGGIWISTNAGTNWVATSGPTNVTSWNLPLSIASSSDGTKLALAGYGYGGGYYQGIWTSSNGGTDWVATSAPTNVSWQSITSSSDGTKLAAVIDGGAIWTSSNSGTNWVQGNAPSAGWTSIASSSTGMNLAAVNNSDTYGSGIWTSRNAGANWGITSAPGLSWSSIASSSDGTKLAAVAAVSYGGDGGIWTSINSGTNWVQVVGPAPDWASTFSNLPWQCIASSSDGTKLAAATTQGIYYNGSHEGGIWTVINGAVSQQSAAISGSTMIGNAGFLEGNFGTVVELIYAGGGQFVALYQTGSISGH
jgi:hypothetical protein